MPTCGINLTSAIVLVEVSESPTKRVYSIQAGVLEKCFPYFEKFRASGMGEVPKRRVQLHEVRPAAFDTVVYWMYKQALSANLKADLWHEVKSLADRLCMDHMMNNMVGL
jgi:hypothetical protein